MKLLLIILTFLTLLSSGYSLAHEAPVQDHGLPLIDASLTPTVSGQLNMWHSTASNHTDITVSAPTPFAASELAITWGKLPLPASISNTYQLTGKLTAEVSEDQNTVETGEANIDLNRFNSNGFTPTSIKLGRQHVLSIKPLFYSGIPTEENNMAYGHSHLLSNGAKLSWALKNKLFSIGVYSSNDVLGGQTNQPMTSINVMSSPDASLPWAIDLVSTPNLTVMPTTSGHTHGPASDVSTCGLLKTCIANDAYRVAGQIEKKWHRFSGVLGFNYSHLNGTLNSPNGNLKYTQMTQNIRVESTYQLQSIPQTTLLSRVEWVNQLTSLKGINATLISLENNLQAQQNRRPLQLTIGTRNRLSPRLTLDGLLISSSVSQHQVNMANMGLNYTW